MIFKVEVNTDNAPNTENFNVAHQLADNLSDVALNLLRGSMEGSIRDINGNVTGKYYFER